MKLLSVVIILFSTLRISAQTDTTKPIFISYPEKTGFGKPMGKLVSKQIGETGGTIHSDDDGIELIFPPGALTSNTNISIQSIENMRGNSSKAYQLEPSGTQFKKPVKIIFNYTDEDIEDCPADLKSFALQDHTGKWTSFEYNEWDSAGKKLSGNIHHFSALVTAESDVMLTPAETEVPVNGYTLVMVQHKDMATSGELAGMNEFAEFAGNRLGFFVNGILDGNGTVGTIKRGSMVFGYTAPELMPRQNPVEIKLAFKYYSRIKKKIAWGVAKCKIAVYDQYKILVEHNYVGRADMNSELSDKGSFVVTVYPNKKFIIEDIDNQPPTVIKEGQNNGFKEKINVSGAMGTINITNSHKNDSLSKSHPPEVYFEFTPVAILMCNVKHGKRGIWGPESPLYFDSIPSEINFIANGKKQVQNHGGSEPYKVTITPVRVE